MDGRAQKRRYSIGKGSLWLLLGSLTFLFLAVYHREELYRRWLRWGGLETVAYENLKSKLGDSRECGLCGNGGEGRMEDFRRTGALGILSLKDLEVLKLSDAKGGQSADGAETLFSAMGRLGEARYALRGSFSGKIVSVTIAMPEAYSLDTEALEEQFCQACLDKVAASLEIRKWRLEQKEAIPLCLVDFQTLKIYSVQEWSQTLIQDSWVEIEPDGRELAIDVYSVG